MAYDAALAVIRERYEAMVGAEAAAALMDPVFFDLEGPLRFFHANGVLVYAVGRDAQGLARLHVFSGAESLN